MSRSPFSSLVWLIALIPPSDRSRTRQTQVRLNVRLDRVIQPFALDAGVNFLAREYAALCAGFRTDSHRHSATQPLFGSQVMAENPSAGTR